MQRGAKDKMQRGARDKGNLEERRKLAEERRRKRQLEAVYRERYPATTSAVPTPNRAVEQIASRPEAWE